MAHLKAMHLLRFILVALVLYAWVLAEETPKEPTPKQPVAAAPKEPADLSPQDRLVLREMQVTALQAALRLKEAEVAMLRGRVQDLEQREKHQQEAKAFDDLNRQLQVKGEALRMRYGAKDYKLTFDLGWEKKLPGEK